MKGICARPLGYGAGILALVALGWILTGNAAGPSQQGFPTDWTHRHVVFSQPSTDAQATAVMHDPRYWHQFNRQHFVRTIKNNEFGLGGQHLFAPAAAPHSDWSQNLGSGANAGAGVFPAKYSFQITSATCANVANPDFVVFSTGLFGGATQATLVAFDNLYSGCTGNVPTVYWAVHTGGRILTSPVFAPGGSQVAFVQTDGGGRGTLVLLKWAAGGTVGSPVAPTEVANGAYRSCTTLPCMTKIVLRDGLGVATDDTTSSVFPDYTHDVIWVGGARGWLHKITGVFRGAPTEVITDGFPVQISNATLSTTSPVYDFASGDVFVGDSSGFLYRVTNATPPVVTKSAQVDFGTGLVASPVVDSTSGKVYVFSSSDGTTNCAGARPCSAVYQFNTNFLAGASGTPALVGSSVAFPATPSPLFDGGFDINYQNSANATGNLYVCGNTGGPPVMYQIPINAGAMGAVVTGPTLSNATTGCSPVTDVSNPNATGGTKEWMFASVQNGGLGNQCGAGGCVMNYLSTQWQPSHAYALGQQVLDSRFNVQTCRLAGTSRTAALGHPNWNATVGGSTTDAGARWINQGPQAAAHGAWQAGHAYALGVAIIDSNGNIEVVTTAGTSRTVALGHPAWSTTINTVTADASVRWRNAGLPATASLAAAGGTGGMIIDNIVGSGVMGGASQVYFSTRSNQACGTSGTGGCAVQASQAGLQ